MRTSSCLSYRGILGFAVLSGLIVTASAHSAAPLEDFTGYTRIGYPPTTGKGAGKNLPAAFEGKAVGLTVYYMVLDRKAKSKSIDKALAGDTFGINLEGFDNTFVASKTSDRRKLDTEARYLYLYQVVNDSGREAAIKDVSVRLIVDPRWITSWGHFAERKTNDKGLVARRGLGFSIGIQDLTAKAGPRFVARPVSTDFQGVSNKQEPYTSPAPAVQAPRTYGIVPISLDQRPAAEGDDTGKEPTAVYITNARFNAVRNASSDFGYIRPSVLSDIDSLPGVDDTVRGRQRERMQDYWPALKAVFQDNQNLIAPKQRSTIFGFTSNLGPVIRETAVNSRQLGIGGLGMGPGAERLPAPKGGIVPAADDANKKDKVARPAVDDAPKKDKGVLPAAGQLPNPDVVPGVRAADLPLVDGHVPTPAPPRIRPAAETTGGLSSPIAPGGGGGALGGLGGIPGGFGGGASLLPGIGQSRFAPQGTGGFGGGGVGGSTGGSTGTNTGTNTGTTTGTNTGTMTNIQTVSLSVAQTQTQAQAQTQQQQQQQQQSNVNSNVNVNVNHDDHGKGQGHHGNVVPAPPAWLLGILGMPIFAFLARRRKPEAGEVSLENPAA